MAGEGALSITGLLPQSIPMRSCLIEFPAWEISNHPTNENRVPNARMIHSPLASPYHDSIYAALYFVFPKGANAENAQALGSIARRLGGRN
jgi:hypothetical protein